MGKEFEISSLPDLLSILDKLKYKSFLYRGEPKKFDKITASGFRYDLSGNMMGDTRRLDYLNQLLSQYYREIESITLFAFFVELKEKKQSRWLFQSQICRIWAS